MPTAINNYLASRAEPCPDWLAAYRPQDPFPMGEFLRSRLVYYPGSGTDGQPVMTFGSAQHTHCFVYADYHKTWASIEAELEDEVRGFRGYQRLNTVTLAVDDLVPKGWTPHLQRGEVRDWRTWQPECARNPYGKVVVLERDAALGDEHGAKRLAIVFLGADGIATYDALFCQPASVRPPHVVVLQDHGFGGNYDQFGRGGLMERVALQAQALPRYLLTSDDTQSLRGYSQISEFGSVTGGQHSNERSLYEWKMV